MITKDTKLPQLKSGFLHALYNMDLFKYDAEELMAQRNCSDFTRYWKTLHDECPAIKDTYFLTIRNDMKKILQCLPKELHRNIALCICEDYRLIATYFMANQSNSDIAYLCLCYSQGEVPMSFFEHTNAILTDAVWCLKNKLTKKMNL